MLSGLPYLIISEVSEGCDAMHYIACKTRCQPVSQSAKHPVSCMYKVLVVRMWCYDKVSGQNVTL